MKPCLHNDPAVYRATPDTSRKGWLRVVCKVCGKWIGYRQVDRKDQAESTRG